MTNSAPEQDPAARIAELEARLAELDARNLQLEREVARRGVKLSCANIALARAKIAFDESSKSREEAVQDIAHDLKTPLTSIKGAAQNVLDGIAGPLDDNVKSYVEIIRDQSQRLISTVNWLVQAIRVTSEALELDAEDIDIGELVSNVVESLKPIAQERGIELSCETHSVIGCLDAAKLSHVLENLISNALKFTDENGRVRVYLAEEDRSFLIGVEDTGVGLSEEAQKKIFNRYYRVNPEAEGSGLGLLIAQEMVRLHGGSIGVESREGEGSTFLVRLPKTDAA